MVHVSHICCILEDLTNLTTQMTTDRHIFFQLGRQTALRNVLDRKYDHSSIHSKSYPNPFTFFLHLCLRYSSDKLSSGISSFCFHLCLEPVELFLRSLFGILELTRLPSLNKLHRGSVISKSVLRYGYPPAGGANTQKPKYYIGKKWAYIWKANDCVDQNKRPET